MEYTITIRTVPENDKQKEAELIKALIEILKAEM